MSPRHTSERLSAALAGRYHIVRELGEGGMATVFLADDLKHERRVALKVLKPELAAVVGGERFLAEIKTTANLHHPHILPLFDSGQDEGLLWYAMPYVEGESLQDRLEREKQLPVDEVVRIGTRIASALQAAHDRGVVHRDIKPANILLSKEEPLVADFGIALAVGAAGGNRLTETGLSVGTPYYMSPEQATGDQPVGPASDVYALAGVLYECLVGDPPFMGSSAQAVLGRILQGSPESTREARPAVPPNVDGAILKGLERYPADRFATAADLARALEDDTFRYGPAAVGTAAAPGAGGGPRFWKPLALAATALAAGSLVVAGIVAAGDAGGGEPLRRLDLRIDMRPSPVGVFHRVALSRDGERMVYVGRGPRGTQLWLRDFSQLEPRPLPDTDRALSPAFSPDGESVAFVSDEGGGRRELRTVAVEGGPSVPLSDSLVDLGSLAWGDDGFIYYDTGFAEDGFSRIPERGGAPELMTVPLTPDVGVSWHFPTDVLPEGRGVLFYSHNPAQVAVLDLRTGDWRPLVDGVSAMYAPSGHLVWVEAGGDLLAAPFDLATLEITGPQTPLAEGVRVLANGGADLGLSDSGTLLYAPDSERSNSSLDFMDEDGVHRPTEDPWQALFLDFARSPDGSTVVASIPDFDTDELLLWARDIEGGPTTQLTFAGRADSPAFSADGGTVLFTSLGPDGQEVLGVYRKALDSLDEPSLVVEAPEVLVGLGPGHSLITGRRDDDGGGGPMVLLRRPLTPDGRVDGPADTVMVIPDFRGGLAVSPDGRWVAYERLVGSDPWVEVRPFGSASGASWRVSEPAGISPLWTRDGSTLTFIEPVSGSLVAVPVEAGSGTFRTGPLRRVPSPLVNRLVSRGADLIGFNAEQRPVLAEPTEGLAGGAETWVFVTGLDALLSSGGR